MSPKVDSTSVGATVRSAWSRDVRPDAAGVTYSRRSYYYDREFSDSIVARSSNDNQTLDGLYRPPVPYSLEYSPESLRRRGLGRRSSVEVAREADLFMRGRVLQSASGGDAAAGEDADKGGKPVRGTLEVEHHGEMENSVPVVQGLPATPLIPRLAASPSGYMNNGVIGDEGEDEDEDSGLTLAGIDVKTIAQGIRVFIRVADAYQRQQRGGQGIGETDDDDDRDADEEGGQSLGWDIDPYHLEAGPSRRYRKKASPNRSSPASKTSRPTLSRSSARSGVLEELQGRASSCTDETTSRSLSASLSASRRVCYYLIGATVFGILASFGIALWWARSQGDASAGFTIGGYVIAVDALIVAIAGIVHRPGCRCWKA